VTNLQVLHPNFVSVYGFFGMIPCIAAPPGGIARGSSLAFVDVEQAWHVMGRKGGGSKCRCNSIRLQSFVTGLSFRAKLFMATLRVTVSTREAEAEPRFNLVRTGRTQLASESSRAFSDLIFNGINPVSNRVQSPKRTFGEVLDRHRSPSITYQQNTDAITNQRELCTEAG
jgi:hypothetical protein